MWESPVSPISLTLGVLLLLLGGIPLFNQWGVLSWGLPSFLTGLVGSVAVYLLAAGGIFLLVDAWGEWGETIGEISLIVGLVILAVGIVQVLSIFKVIPWMIALPMIVYNILFVVEGILLVLGSWMQF